MSFLLDTNVVSEWTRPQPNRGVITWLEEADEDRVFLSVVTIAELRHGIERLAAGSRRKQLDSWLCNELQLRFESRILPVTLKVAHRSGRVVAHGEGVGKPLAAMDALIAATVLTHGLTLVTRNTTDFGPVLESMLNPWS
jgi:predicted nucleic acid-binding protein